MQIEGEAHGFEDPLLHARGPGDALAPSQGNLEPTENARAPVARASAPKVLQAKATAPASVHKLVDARDSGDALAPPQGSLEATES